MLDRRTYIIYVWVIVSGFHHRKPNLSEKLNHGFRKEHLVESFKVQLQTNFTIKDSATLVDTGPAFPAFPVF